MMTRMMSANSKNATYLQAEEGAKTTGATRADNGAERAVASLRNGEGVVGAAPPVTGTTTETRKTVDRTGNLEVVVGAVAAVAEVAEDMLAAAMTHLKSRSIHLTKRSIRNPKKMKRRTNSPITTLPRLPRKAKMLPSE